jgi:F-type H+-transporting ATPase subunit b
VRNPHWLLKASTHLFVASATLIIADVAHASGELVLVPDLGELIGLVIAFTVLIFPLNALIFRPLLDVFEAREEKIQGATEAANQIAQRAEELLARYQESVRSSREEISAEKKALVQSARREEETLTSAERSTAETALTAAREELATATESIRGELRDSARALGRDAATRIMGRELS